MILLQLICLTAISFHAKAEVVLNPDSRHGQYTTYGLFFEPQSEVIDKSGGNAWGNVGGYISLAEFKGLKWSPQLVLHASANASYRLVSDLNEGTVLTKFETIDARVGLAWDMKFTDEFRGTVIWTHDSGHISDNIEIPALIGPDVGDEIFDFRVIRDFHKTWRVGAGFRPAVVSNPKMQFFGAEEFVEWFPKGPASGQSHLAPFVAAGLEQYGTDAIELTGHLQMGWATGDHFAEEFHKALRFVVGAYSGQDVRLKYFKYEGTQSHFVYAGLFVDL
jgi:hypothetical protein